MGDGRDKSKFSDHVTPTAINAQKTLALMARNGLCLSYTYGTGLYALTKGRLEPGDALPESFGKDSLDWLLERGLITDAGEPRDEDECRYFLTAEGRRQGRKAP